MLQRILIAGSVALFVVTIAEVGYLAYSQFKPNKKPVVITQTTIAPSVTGQPQAEQPTSQRRIQVADAALVSSFLINNYEGEIKEIDKNGGDLPGPKGLKYKVKLTIEKEPSKPVSFYFNNAMISKTTLVNSPSGTNPLDSLNVGDRIKLKLVWTVDPTTKAYNIFSSAEIEK